MVFHGTPTAACGIGDTKATVSLMMIMTLIAGRADNLNDDDATSYSWPGAVMSAVPPGFVESRQYRSDQTGDLLEFQCAWRSLATGGFAHSCANSSTGTPTVNDGVNTGEEYRSS